MIGKFHKMRECNHRMIGYIHIFETRKTIRLKHSSDSKAHSDDLMHFLVAFVHSIKYTIFQEMQMASKAVSQRNFLLFYSLPASIYSTRFFSYQLKSLDSAYLTSNTFFPFFRSYISQFITAMARGRGRLPKNDKQVEEAEPESAAEEEYEVERVESHQITGKGVSFFFPKKKKEN